MSGSRSVRAPTDVLMVAGEASGDLHGATLARALTTLAPGLRLAGMGGARMAAAGVRLVQAPQHAQERGLARAVRSAQPDALAVGDLPRHRVEQHAFAESFGERLKLNHEKPEAKSQK